MELAVEAQGSRGDEQVWAVAPPLEEPAEILSAELIPLIIVQLGPLPVLEAHQRQGVVGDIPVPFVLELEAVVDVQVTVEPEALAHEADVLDGLSPKRHAISLEGIGVALLYFFVEVLHVVSGQPVGPKNPHRLIGVWRRW